MTKPNSLVVRRYKARYFPNSSLFDSKIRHNPSYAWRCIWKARHILMHGCRWSIGSGTSIRVMDDPWLRGNDGAWIPSPYTHDVYKIESIFPLHVAKRILEIPLFGTVEDDTLVWMDNTNGMYSVKSGYKVILNVTGMANEISHQEEWSHLWNIRAPPKAKHLLWRISKGCLPTRMHLQDKWVPCTQLCPLCNQENEDDWHVLFHCETSVQARQRACLEHLLLPRLQQQNNARDAIFSICSTTDKDTAGVFVVLLWVLWSNRNNKVWNEVTEPGRLLGLKARHYWDEWNFVHTVQLGMINPKQQQQFVRWEKPLSGWYKCNVDAAFHQAPNKTSIIWCLRDHLGRFIMAGTTWIDGSCSIEEGESVALIEALKVMEQRGYSDVF
ncbi:hypothetical protein QL285_009162 [Trifolium repens]|nr:hypothetical protein QL285_009162 [Trifolium repens]